MLLPIARDRVGGKLGLRWNSALPWSKRVFFGFSSAYGVMLILFFVIIALWFVLFLSNRLIYFIWSPIAGSFRIQRRTVTLKCSGHGGALGSRMNLFDRFARVVKVDPFLFSWIYIFLLHLLRQYNSVVCLLFSLCFSHMQMHSWVPWKTQKKSWNKLFSKWMMIWQRCAKPQHRYNFILSQIKYNDI